MEVVKFSLDFRVCVKFDGGWWCLICLWGWGGMGFGFGWWLLSGGGVEGVFEFV